MMLSATISAETRGFYMNLLLDPHEICMDEEFNQIVNLVKSVQPAVSLDKLLMECNFPLTANHSGLNQENKQHILFLE
eukprot:11718367-Heterocapsa_arctica.AAC.1